MVYRLLIVLMLFTGCKGVKNVVKSDQSKSLKESVLTRSSRQGDSIQLTLPNIKYKDTTIYNYNRVGTQLITKYDENGNVDVKCIESSVNEMTLAIKELSESKSEKNKSESFQVSNLVVLVVLGVVFFLIIIVLLVAVFYIKSIL